MPLKVKLGSLVFNQLNNEMKLMLAGVFLIAGSSVYGQCKYTMNKKDEFTGQKKIATKNRILFGADGGVGFYVANLDNREYVVFTLYTFDVTSNNENSHVLIKFTDGKMLKVKLDNEGNGYTHGVNWALPYFLPLDKKSKSLFTEKQIQLLRFETNDGPHDRRLKLSAAKKINKSINCI